MPGLYTYIYIYIHIYLLYVSISFHPTDSVCATNLTNWQYRPTPFVNGWTDLRICHAIGFRRHLRHAVHDLKQGKKKPNLVDLFVTDKLVFKSDISQHTLASLINFDMLESNTSWKLVGSFFFGIADNLASIYNHQHILDQAFPELLLQLPTLAMINMCKNDIQKNYQ